MSLGHGEETHLLEEGVRPTLMIGTPGETSTVLTSTKDRPQPPSNPPINGREGINVAVLEVGEPASEDRIDDLNDPFKTVSAGSARLLSDGILELSQTLLARLASPLLEVISEEVEPAWRRGVDESGLLRMER
jgi:hypothetical protein